jgi:amidase
LVDNTGPTTPYASVSHDDFRYVGYTGIFNILDYSALSFPTGIKADAKLDANDPKERPLSELCESIQKLCK